MRLQFTLRSFRHLFQVATLALCVAGASQAAFIGPYAPGNFTLTNLDTDGTAQLQLNGSLVLTGGNTGSGLPGTTTFLISSAGPGTVSFDFSYSTLDDVLAEVAGYMVGSTFTQLADRNGGFGPVSFAVTAGQSFGFRIDTADNLGEPGYLTISNFSAPAGSAAVPEPATWLTGLAGVALLAAARRHTKV